MEKFALLNLLKAIDGLKSAQKEQRAEPKAPSAPPPEASHAAPQTNAATMPNIMYEALVRHEQISNRLKNKK